MTMKKENKALRTHVLDELDWAPNVDAENIGVAVSDGVVTLSGSVPSYAEKRAAERAVLRVAGVKGIANDLTVRLPDKFERSDTDIAKAARRAIEWHTELPTDKIKVKVDDGWVTLDGTVSWNYQRVRAETAVRYLAGVRGVSNQITVKSRPVPGDVRERIRKALERRADRETDRLSITVEGETVTLKGTVDSWADREDIERAVWDAPGVSKVHNKLNVDAEAYAY
jgi:osmotically-inducible protein OsmY